MVTKPHAWRRQYAAVSGIPLRKGRLDYPVPRVTIVPLVLATEGPKQEEKMHRLHNRNVKSEK